MIDFERDEYGDDEGTMTISCDEVACGEDVQFEGTWQECIDQAKAAGWKIRKDGAEWTHICPADAQEQERAFWED